MPLYGDASTPHEKRHFTVLLCLHAKNARISHVVYPDMASICFVFRCKIIDSNGYYDWVICFYELPVSADAESSKDINIYMVKRITNYDDACKICRRHIVK